MVLYSPKLTYYHQNNRKRTHPFPLLQRFCTVENNKKKYFVHLYMYSKEMKTRQTRSLVIESFSSPEA